MYKTFLLFRLKLPVNEIFIRDDPANIHQHIEMKL